MDIQKEIKGIIQIISDLTNNSTEDNAQSIAVYLNELNQFIQEQFSNSNLATEFNQFSRKLKDKIENIKQNNQIISQEILKNEDLLKQKQEIEAKNNQLIHDLEILNKLKQKYESNKALAQTHLEIINITNENNSLIKSNIEILKTLNKHLDINVSDLEKQLSLNAEKASDSLLTLAITLDTTKLKNDFPQLEMEFQELVTNYNYHVTKIKTIKEDLEIISKEYDIVISVFKEHHLENNQIFGALQNREGVLEYVKNICTDISRKLEEYDSSIKSIIEKRDKLPMYELAENKIYQ